MSEISSSLKKEIEEINHLLEKNESLEAGHFITLLLSSLMEEEGHESKINK